MDYTMEEKCQKMKQILLVEKSKNPIEIAKKLMQLDCINIHGPEHHFLDGGSFLTAYRNVILDFDLDNALEELAKRTIKMPGAMCGYWGVCGSSTSLGAAMSIIHQTGPLSSSKYYGMQMKYTSSVVRKMSEIGGPRCCKRNAFLALSMAVSFMREEENILFEESPIVCEFSSINKQCIKERCPFHKNK